MSRKLKRFMKMVSVPTAACLLMLGLTGCGTDKNSEEVTEVVKEADDITENVQEDITETVQEDVKENVQKEVADNVQDDVTENVREDAKENAQEEAKAGGSSETMSAASNTENLSERNDIPEDGKTHISDEADGAYARVIFSGNPDEIVKFDKHTYYEGDDFFIFFQKDTEVPGDTAVFVDQIMAELEEVEHMKYSDGEDDGDSYWRDYHFDGQFVGINEDCDKINIFVLNDPENGNIECATVNECILYDDDFTESGISGSEGTVYHELAHVLRLRQSPYLGDVMEEGVALYSEYELMMKHDYRDFSMVQYVDDLGEEKLRDAGIYENPERAYWYISDDDDNIEQLDYQYGFRFVCFLYDEYGDDVIKNIGEVASKTKYDDYETDPSILIEIIKKGTSEDVYERFGEWLPEHWPEKSAECNKFLGLDSADYMR